MKKIQILALLFFSLNSFSQTVSIEGNAFDSTKGLNPVLVAFNEFTTENSVMTKDDGYFEIKAKETDTLFFRGFRHFTKSFLVADLLKMKTINIILEPIPCETYVECKDTTPKFFVFIGEKIKVQGVKEKYYCNVSTMDGKFYAEYKIIKNLNGEYPKDSIHFVAYDHYGFPPFAGYKHSILFVTQYCGQNFHVKYQFIPVYKTIDNRWAGAYLVGEYSKLDSNSKIKPEIIPFQEPVVFDILPPSGGGRRRPSYPQPFYKIENGKATVVYGNYIPELLELKKPVIKSYGLELK